MPDVVFARLFRIKNAHEELLADNLTDDTQASIPACVKYRFVEPLFFMAEL